jgi:putative FmdB family regulatory protein
MPYYEYLCNKGHETTVEQRITADSHTTCPQEKCRAQCKRLISKTSFKLNGNGWTPKPQSYWMDTRDAPKE